MFFAGFFVDEDEVASRLVAKVKEYGLKFTDDMTDYRDPHRNIQAPRFRHRFTIPPEGTNKNPWKDRGKATGKGKTC